MSSLGLGLIGNSNIGALVDASGDIVWACMPRFDSEPVFDALLRDADGQGCYRVELLDCERTTQRYVENTAILITTLYDKHGGIVELTDFAPKFKHLGRMFRPISLVRHVKPLAGSPRVRICARPSLGYGQGTPDYSHGSNHIRYLMPGLTLRLTTDASITALLDECPFMLESAITLVLGPDESLSESPSEVGRKFYQETHAYWREWVRYLGIPFEWQDAVIRAAITLKLNSFDDTGAVIAAVTTSIPEAPNSGRNWDYRYCWLRDAYFVVTALNRLGATQTMERYLRYIINVAAGSDKGHLQPVYGINGRADLTERQVDTLPGYRGMGPVRVGNEAYTQVQNDVYGAAVLAATHVFFDQRIERPGDESLFQRLEILGEHAIEVHDQPDAGPWELRNAQRVHTFPSVMCWAACDRLARIANQLRLDERAAHWRREADTIHRTISKHAWDEQQKSFVASFGGTELDASLLLLHELGFLRADDPRFASTVGVIEQNLKHGDFLFRYTQQDDFGVPQTAFTICTFWYVDALAALGRLDEARTLFDKLLSCRNSLGLLSEDLNPDTGELWGNFPQTYSMVGLINSAMRLSKDWEDVF